jgi:hypothetical protein
MAAGIISVFFGRSPSKIAENAIKAISVAMAPLMRIGGLASYESLKNEHVNAERLPFSKLKEGNDRVSDLGYCVTKNLTFKAQSLRSAFNHSIDGPNPANVRYFVEPFISNYRTPLFHYSRPSLGMHTDHYTGGENA